MGNSNPHGYSSSSTAEDVTLNVDLNNKVILITGANTGIGKETARVLALRGAHVIITCRDDTKVNATVADLKALTGSEKIEGISMDLSSFVSIRAGAQAFLDKNLPLHVLINNAGIMAVPWATTTEGFESTFGVNHYGHFLFTGLLLQKLIESAPSRIVVLSSEAHKMGAKDILTPYTTEASYNQFHAYGNSKLANVLFAKSLHQRLVGHDVWVNSVHPGVIHTDLGRSSGMAKAFYFLSTPFLKSIPQGASTTCFVATHPSISSDPNVGGNYYADNMIAKLAPLGEDMELAEQLWQLSETATGFQYPTLSKTILGED